MKRASAIVGIVIFVFVMASTGIGSPFQADEKEASEKLIKSARFLEQKPLDKDTKELRAWAIKWLIVTDKVSVKVCSLMLGVEKKYKYSSDLFTQYTIGMAAYKLSNPDKAQDEDAAQLAGVESAVTAYEAIVAEQSKLRNAFMDELVAKRSQGTLPGYVKENCNNKDKK
jgi:hypothetical protein